MSSAPGRPLCGQCLEEVEGDREKAASLGVTRMTKIAGSWGCNVHHFTGSDMPDRKTRRILERRGRRVRT